MKKIVFIFTFSILMSSCASNDVAVQPLQENLSSEVQSSSVDKNFLEKIEGYYGAPTTSILDKTNLSELLVRVKSLTGSLKYDNVNSASKYTLYIKDEFVSAGKIRFGKDAKLYFEEYHFSAGNSFYQYYEIGTYEKLKTGIKQGSDVNYKINSAFEMKYKGRGLNPMNHEEIHLLTSSNVKPVKKDLKDFL